MKKMKLIPMMLVGLMMSAMCLTSCNTDDDYPSLTPEQIQSAFLTVKGTHSGQLIFRKNSSTKKETLANNNDTIKNVSWTIDTDSTMIIHNFPARALTEFISDSQKELKEALAQQSDKKLECVIGFVQLSPVVFLVNPKTLTYELTYNGAAHKVQIAFWYNNYSSAGIYSSTTKSMEMQLLMGGIYEDGNLKSEYLSEQAVPLLFQSKR